MALCCCAVRKSTIPKRSESQKTAEPHTTHVTPDSHELIPVIVEQALDPAVSQSIPADVDDEFRPRSASEPHKPGTILQKPHPTSHTPSLRDIPEETTSNTLQAVGTSQTQTSKSTLSCVSAVSDNSSGYLTPLSARHCVTTVKEHDNHTLIERLEKAEKDNTELREKMEQERTELMKVISGLTQRIEELEAEKCMEKQERDTPDKDGMLQTTSQLPQNCSVSTDVLVGLAKRMTQWRFLARRLHLQESDIQQIGVNFSNDVQEQSYQMLLKWKLSLSCNSDAYHTLGEAVREELGETLYSDYVTMVREAEAADVH